MDAAGRLARGVVAVAFGVVLTLDASVQEFAELIALSEHGRRARFSLSPSCTPLISAVKPAAPNAGRLTVIVGCSTPPAPPPSPIRPASWEQQ